ncbi:MAG: MBL fold metallo-hydrolase [Patescibacteria group bacterium]
MDLSNVAWYGHDCYTITTKVGKVVYFDPFKIPDNTPKADVIFVTHEHHDHCSPEDINKIYQDGTVIVGSPQTVEKLEQAVTVIKPGEQKTIADLVVLAVPAYNLNKWRSPGVPYHPKEDLKVGFVVTIDNVKYYHAGDTDLIPEMKEIKTDVVFLPVSGTYVMTADEAIEAAKVINPRMAIPMHYGEIVGTVEDADKFKAALDIPVTIMEKTG